MIFQKKHLDYETQKCELAVEVHVSSMFNWFEDIYKEADGRV